VRTADLPEGEARVPLKEVHANRCPALVAWPHLREADFARLGIDRAQAEARAARLRPHAAELAEKVRRVFAGDRARDPADPDASLYDGFTGDGDRRRLQQVRATPPHLLGARDFGFADPRLTELLFRYRARNWPDTLTADERARWDDYRRRRLLTDSGLSELGYDAFRAELARLRAQHAGDGARLALLDQLEAWGLEITTTLR
jgi:exodeoxyribonuclease-1